MACLHVGTVPPATSVKISQRFCPIQVLNESVKTLWGEKNWLFAQMLYELCLFKSCSSQIQLTTAVVSSDRVEDIL